MTGQDRQEGPEPFPVMKMLIAGILSIIAIYGHKARYKLGLVEHDVDEHYRILLEGTGDE